MTTALIIFSIFAAFYSGFYFGYLKREGKPPEKMPIVGELTELAKELKPEKQERPDKEELKANSFYN